MRKYLALPAFAFFAAAATAPAMAYDWQSFHDPDGAYAADFPSPPAVIDGTTPGMDGAPVPVRELSVDGDNISFLVIVADLAGYPNTDPAQVLQNAVDGEEKGAARTLSDTVVSLDGQSGRDVVMLDGLNNRIEDRAYFVNHRIYQVMTAASSQATQADAMDGLRFQDSFHFTQ